MSDYTFFVLLRVVSFRTSSDFQLGKSPAVCSLPGRRFPPTKQQWILHKDRKTETTEHTNTNKTHDRPGAQTPYSVIWCLSLVPTNLDSISIFLMLQRRINNYNIRAHTEACMYVCIVATHQVVITLYIKWRYNRRPIQKSFFFLHFMIDVILSSSLCIPIRLGFIVTYSHMLNIITCMETSTKIRKTPQFIFMRLNCVWPLNFTEGTEAFGMGMIWVALSGCECVINAHFRCGVRIVLLYVSYVCV